jgi:hypothetical protein
MSYQQQTRPNDLNLFMKKVGLRLVMLVILLLVLFHLPVPKKYFYESMDRTIHSKLNWVWNKLNSSGSLDSTVVFVGSSVCFYGINDQLLSQTDTSGLTYLNLGVVHHCNDITDVVLREMILRNDQRPYKVVLCLKSDAMARDVHHMFPLAASVPEISQSLALGNFQFLPTVLKRISWNINYVTGITKFDTGEDSLQFRGEFGFQSQKMIDSLMMEKKYRAHHAGMESVLNYLETSATSENGDMKSKLISAKRNYLDNEYFQNRIFERSAQLLDEHQIDYTILLYPNFAASRAGKEEAMAAYAKSRLKGIDYDRHPILVVKDPRLSEAASWVDMNHLSEAGAQLFSLRVREMLLSQQQEEMKD